MAKDKKGKLFFEITKEKPLGKSNVLLTGASVGSAVSFFIVSVLGSLYGMGMDNWVFIFLIASIVGFFLAGVLTWLFMVNFSKVVSASALMEPQTAEVKPAESAQSQPPAETGVPSEEDKGQSVDFVFPELAPDK